MKSFCIKTNNADILNYLLNRIKEIDFENLVYIKKQFKIYDNIIIHYLGKNTSDFDEFLCTLLEEVIFNFYQEKIMKQLINYNYFYFDEYERKKILENCFENIDEDEILEIEPQIANEITSYLKEHHSVILDGFVNFRLKEYYSFLDNVVDAAVNQFVIEKEYTEFISLLRIYIESRPAQTSLLHLIYNNGESIILDEEKNIVSVSDNIYNAKYLSDISFSSNDIALNTLLTLLPKKIEIHVIGEEDEFINTLKLIFENRIYICRECNICKTYHILERARR